MRTEGLIAVEVLDGRENRPGSDGRSSRPRPLCGTLIGFAGVVGLMLCCAACRQDMHDQPRYKPLASTDAFADGRSARLPVPGTVARGQLREDALLHTGKAEGKFSRNFPFPVTRQVMQRGRERFDIFCAPCHDRLGTGRGMVVRRGLSQPPSFHIDRLRAVEHGYIFDVITSGFGRMSSYAAQIPVEDRWAIVAYVRVLQYSQHAPLDDVPPAARPRLDAEEAAPPAPGVSR